MSQADIRARIEVFTRELEGLVRDAALAAVSEALGQRVARAARPSTRPSPASQPSPIAVAPASSPSPKLAFKRKKGSKRTPEQLVQIDNAIISFVKASPGQGVEHMGKALRVPTSDLKLRVLGLLEQKKLKKTGAKRATKYFPA